MLSLFLDMVLLCWIHYVICCLYTFYNSFSATMTLRISEFILDKKLWVILQVFEQNKTAFVNC